MFIQATEFFFSVPPRKLQRSLKSSQKCAGLVMKMKKACSSQAHW